MATNILSGAPVPSPFPGFVAGKSYKTKHTFTTPSLNSKRTTPGEAYVSDVEEASEAIHHANDALEGKLFFSTLSCYRSPFMYLQTGRILPSKLENRYSLKLSIFSISDRISSRRYRMSSYPQHRLSSIFNSEARSIGTYLNLIPPPKCL